VKFNNEDDKIKCPFIGTHHRSTLQLSHQPEKPTDEWQTTLKSLGNN